MLSATSVTRVVRGAVLRSRARVALVGLDCGHS